jgi:hypothetical protein
MSPSEAHQRGGGSPPPPWTAGDLRRPGTLLAAVLGLLVSVPLSLNASCQAHEFGHALTGTALGWEVERIHLCLPTGGNVQYATTSGGGWADAAESYAGGITGALFLVAVYLLVFYVPKTPLRSPAWFGAGFGPVLWIGTQLAVAMVEGAIRDHDYGQVLDANRALMLAVVLATMVTGAAAHIWLWRSVWKRQAS